MSLVGTAAEPDVSVAAAVSCGSLKAQILAVLRGNEHLSWDA
jgi:hypothetical protein